MDFGFSLPLPAGEGWGEGIQKSAFWFLASTPLSQRSLCHSSFGRKLDDGRGFKKFLSHNDHRSLIYFIYKRGVGEYSQ